jgi:signal transduction histidine kinase
MPELSVTPEEAHPSATASTVRRPIVSGGLTRRTVLAGSLLALLVGGAFAILVSSLAELRESDRRALRSADVLVAANALERLVLDIESAERGFLITRQESFLQPWTSARLAFPEQATALERLVADRPEQRIRAERIDRAGASYVREHSIPMIDVARRAPPAAQVRAASQEGERRVAALRADFAALVATERGLAAAARRDSGAAGRHATLAGVGGLIGSVALIVLFTGYLSQSVVRPVRRATTMAGRLAGGDLGARVPEGGADEVGALAHSLNTMAGALGENREQLAASRARIVAAGDRERRRIERDLHDGTQQRLVSLMLDLRNASAAPDDLTRLRARLGRVAEGLSAALDELRETSRGIHPAVLSEGGLPPAIKALARRSAVPVEVSVDLGCRLPEQVEVAAYYVVSEALANAAKHARASATRVAARAVGGSLHLCVHDDGVGGARIGAGSGLTGLADRVASLGGRIAVTSPHGQGTAVVAELPVSWPVSDQDGQA